MIKKFIFKITTIISVVLVSSCGNGGRPGVTVPTSQSPSNRSTINQNPNNIQQVNKSATKTAVFNVYVENSGSMDGYVRGATDFENSVYSYLSDIQNCDELCSEMNLFYINSEIHCCPLKNVDDNIKFNN